MKYSHYLKKYRRWCRLFPTPFRKQFGGEIEQVFLTSLAEAEKKYGVRGVQIEYRAAVVDVIPAILHEQLTSLPTLQSFFASKNVIWKLYVVLYWPLVALLILAGWNSPDASPVIAVLGTLLYLLAYLAIWFATATVRIPILVLVGSVLPFYVIQSLGGLFFLSEFSSNLVNTLSLVSAVVALATPFTVSIVLHARKHRVGRARVLLHTTEELEVQDARSKLRKFRRNTGVICVILMLILVNVGVLAVDSAKFNDAHAESVVNPPYPGSDNSPLERNNAYYKLMNLDGLPKVQNDYAPFYSYRLKTIESKTLSPEVKAKVQEQALRLASDLEQFKAAGELPHFMHPALSTNRNWPLQTRPDVDILPHELNEFHHFVQLHSLSLDQQGKSSEAAEYLIAGANVGRLIAAGAPTDWWYAMGLTIIGDVREVLPLMSSETEDLVEAKLPSASDIYAMREEFLATNARVAMAAVQDFERESSLAGLTLLYLPSETRILLRERITSYQQWRATCDDTSRFYKRYAADFSKDYSYVSSQTVPKVKSYMRINGTGEYLVAQQFMASGEADAYQHLSFGMNECYALGKPVQR